MENSKVHFLSDPAPFREKERLYLDARRREGRVLPDAELRLLPNVSVSNPHAHEWRWRRRSFARLVARLSKSSTPFRILDLGCGNGWMANRLAENPLWEVWAADVNEAELEQGARLFGRANLRFVYADVAYLAGITEGIPEKSSRATFDAVILAASVQYFSDLPALITSLRKILSANGQIHILDSQFYPNEAARTAARQRTLAYYTTLGVPEMVAFYHHHLWADAKKLGGVNLNNTLAIRFLQKIKWLAPFPWVRL